METIVSEPDMSYSGLYSYADYLRWTVEKRFELIKGKLFEMSVPGRLHQNICGNIFVQLRNFLYKKPCSVYISPFDVRLPRKNNRDEDIITVLQPDLCVICDPAKLDDRGCFGAPDIVVEILSPGNNKKELKNKYDVYEEAGVKEYWMISPQNQTFLAYRLNATGRFDASRMMTIGDEYATEIIPEFALNLEKVFDEG